jgi:hypothetical protein
MLNDIVTDSQAGRIVMPYVNISLTRGKSREYLQGVSDAVHQALVEGLGVNPDDRFQAITRHEPGDLVYPRVRTCSS